MGGNLLDQGDLMLASDMKRLGDTAFSRSIHPLRRQAVREAAVVGFDAEYESKSGKLISYQLYANGRGVFVPCSKMSADVLVRDAVKLLGRRPNEIVLVSYFSLAELQFLPVFHGSIGVKEFGRGSLDVLFPSRYKIPLEVFDMARWFDFQSLANAAKSIGLEKLEWDRKHVVRSNCRDPKFRKYAVNDAYLVYELAVRLREEFAALGVDILTARTPASASASVFRLHHVEEKLYCDSNRARLVAVRGTWGGRTETYRRGRVPMVVEADISSAYPNAAIRLGVLPVQKSWVEAKSLGHAEKFVGGFMRVRFRFPKDEPYPCLPVVTEEADAQVYPRRGESWATLDEVRLAVEIGADVRLIEGWVYKRGTTALADYMSELLAKRKSATGAAKVALKLQANSLIGKFAQHVPKITIEELYRVAEACGLLIEELIDMSKDEQIALGAKADVQIGAVWMPEWNGLITGHTRARLGRMIREGRAVYSATDAVWIPDDRKLDIRPEFNSTFEGTEVKRRGPATLARTRLAAIWSDMPDNPHVVHHSIWSWKAGRTLLEKFAGGKDVTIKYPIRRPLKFREAAKKRKQVGTWVQEWRQGDTRWDGKRVLFPNGSTEPHETIDSYLDFARERE